MPKGKAAGIGASCSSSGNCNWTGKLLFCIVFGIGTEVMEAGLDISAEVIG